MLAGLKLCGGGRICVKLKFCSFIIYIYMSVIIEYIKRDGDTYKMCEALPQRATYKMCEALPQRAIWSASFH